MRNTQSCFRFTLALALCAHFCLATALAVAGPPRASDVNGDLGLRRCPALGKTKVVRRDSFQAAYMGYEESETGDSGAGWAYFRLPSGKTVRLVCDEVSARKWFGKKRGRMATVRYEVWRYWPHTDYCVQSPVCVAPKRQR